MKALPQVGYSSISGPDQPQFISNSQLPTYYLLSSVSLKWLSPSPSETHITIHLSAKRRKDNLSVRKHVVGRRGACSCLEINNLHVSAFEVSISSEKVRRKKHVSVVAASAQTRALELKVLTNGARWTTIEIVKGEKFGFCFSQTAASGRQPTSVQEMGGHCESSEKAFGATLVL